MTTRISPTGRIRIGLIQFPGSNCDTDCADTLKRHFDINSRQVWHQETSLPELDAVIIPGGFSFGDYMRSGALAARAPIMFEVRRFAERGGAVLGICNGFQVLVESQMLPGALLRNATLGFVCKSVHLLAQKGNVLTMPIAHGEGRYWIDERGLSDLENRDLIAFRYSNKFGTVSCDFNPNGSVANIAGVFSPGRKILGMMPHPERATDDVMGGSVDGLTVIRDFLDHV